MKIESKLLTCVTTELLRAMGVEHERALCVANSLILSDLRGGGTHGVALLPLYAEMIKNRAIDIHADPVIRVLSNSIGLVNGRNAFGQLTGRAATELGVKLAAEQGVAVVGIRDGAHLGRLSEWAEMACSRGISFIALTNTGGGAQNVSGPKGSQRVLSTNPVAFGVPVFGALDHDIVIDFATSQVSGSTIRERYNSGKPLDEGWIVTNDGDPSVDPEAFMTGLASLLPLGGQSSGHKGFGLMVAAELFSAFAGGLIAGEREDDWFSNGGLFIFLDTTVFTSTEVWKEKIRGFSAYLASKGCRLPGAGSVARENISRKQGIVLADHIIAGISNLAGRLNVKLPAEFCGTKSTITDSKTKSW